MAILGSANLVQSFVNLGLIDEYLLMVVPVIMGVGKPLFTGIAQRRNLKLVEATTTRGGNHSLGAAREAPGGRCTRTARHRGTCDEGASEGAR